eukprot:CAMPEP_0167747046 /NCGR_PEP_ID=MMETSP0110_2-20121227/4057_1 /TAXON_ID=629695 /ORGANISM="Gymnochlora sp., Strain CCMP2014" /LENGTH=290 /DNA_ID=CAMNT_0007631891 /DNA_START=163 /DNA_END=1035 /DNA_ORIENTATION=+
MRSLATNWYTSTISRPQSLPIVYNAGLAGAAGVLAAAAPRVAGTDSLQSILPLLFAQFVSSNDAAQKGRLSSETYRRLNMSIMLFSLITILTFAYSPTGIVSRIEGTGIELGAIRKMLVNPITVTLAFLPGVLAGFTGWHRGVFGGIPKLGKDFVQGVKNVYPDLVKSRTVFGKLFTGLLVAHMILFLDLLPVSTLLGSGPFEKILSAMSYASMEIVILSTLYTLQQAAERGRLNATTFRHLNLGLAISSLISLLRLVSKNPFGAIVPAATAGISLTAYIKAKIENSRMR